MSASKIPSSQDSASVMHIQEVDCDDINAKQDEVPESNGDCLLARKGRKKRSKVHEIFSQELIRTASGSELRWKCRDCPKSFKIIPSGTTSHLTRHSKFECMGRENVDKKQKTLSFGAPSSQSDFFSTPALSSTKFDQMKARELIAKFIIAHEHPFSIVEEFWFTILLKYFNPNFTKVSRATITNDCMKIFHSEKEKLRKSLSNVHMISLTSDTWTSIQTIGYMCLTAHYVDSNWKLQKHILNFFELEPPHTGIVIADAILNCLVEWGIDSKVSSITLDNASSNDVVVRTLVDTFRGRGCLFFQGKIFHVRCSAHILNLMVQDGLSTLDNAISKIRESVKYLKKSAARLKKFGDIAKQLNIPTSRGLSMDVPTRWNSTFFMLDSALSYKSVFQNYARRDDNYKWLPSEEDWEKAEKIRPLLKLFYEVTQVFSGTSYPTANLFLPKIWKVAEILKEKVQSDDEYIKKMVVAMKEKFDKYWKECSLLMSIATVLDPRYKLKSIEFIYERIYEVLDAQEHIANLRNAMSDLCEFYANRIGMNNKESKLLDQNGESSNPFKSEMTSEAELDNYLDNVESEPPEKSDFDRYLEEPTLRSRKGDPTFDVLDWWKSNSLKFPILSMMASELLSIPVTSVASESAFSTGGRVLTDYRSSLLPKTVEALVCTADWIRNSEDIAKSSNVDISQDESLNVMIPI